MEFNVKIKDVDVVGIGISDKALEFKCDIYFKKEKREIVVIVPVRNENNEPKTKEEIVLELHQKSKREMQMIVDTEKKYSLDYYRGSVYGLNTED